MASLAGKCIFSEVPKKDPEGHALEVPQTLLYVQSYLWIKNSPFCVRAYVEHGKPWIFSGFHILLSFFLLIKRKHIKSFDSWNKIHWNLRHYKKVSHFGSAIFFSLLQFVWKWQAPITFHGITYLSGRNWCQSLILILMNFARQFSHQNCLIWSSLSNSNKHQLHRLSYGSFFTS